MRADFMRWVLRLVGELPADPIRADLWRRFVGLFGLALVTATWRLWTPQRVFPQVPLFSVLDGVPDFLQWAASAVMVFALAAMVVAPRGSRAVSASLVTFAAAASLMILIDQGRFQPWAYQFILVAVVLALVEAHDALPLLRLLIVSFYFHSAVTKLDYTFLHTLGQQFLAALAGIVGTSLDHWSESARLTAASVFPVGELLIAVGLCFARTRTAALIGAVLLHLVLLAILGPWGLDHKPAVLIWNSYFIVQDVLLFWIGSPRPNTAPAGDAPRDHSMRALVSAQTIVWAAVLLPFLAPIAWFDMWPSWGLYAPAAERVQLLVHRREAEELPDPLRSLAVASPDADQAWLTLRLDRWALDVLGAPIYPQNRYQMGVAECVILRYGLVHRLRVVRFELADRRTGERQSDLFASLAKMVTASSEYFFNARPRQWAFAPDVADR